MAITRAVCYDFDGVIARYDGWKGYDEIGLPNESARAPMIEHRKQGRKIIIFTARLWHEDADGTKFKPSVIRGRRQALIQWLRYHCFPFDELHGKPIAAAYVDDRGVGVPSNPSVEQMTIATARVQELLDSEG